MSDRGEVWEITGGNWGCRSRCALRIQLLPGIQTALQYCISLIFEMHNNNVLFTPAWPLHHHYGKTAKSKVLKISVKSSGVRGHATGALKTPGTALKDNIRFSSWSTHFCLICNFHPALRKTGNGFTYLFHL